jgi:hypothetical protein
MKIIVTELKLGEGWNSEFVCYHTFTFPEWGEKYDFRSRRRCNVFFNNGKPGRSHTKTRLFTYRHECEPALLVTLEKSPKTVEHESIDAFFEYIGFDYKAKKYK